MLKKILVSLLALFAAVAFAAVDVNKATQAELETVKGIGPAIAGKILEERKKASFKDWSDMVARVKGVGDGNAAKFSSEGLTVNGASFAGAPAKPAATATTAAKKDAAPAAAAKPAALTADEKKAAAKKEKEAKKAAKEAAAEEAKKAKAEKAAARKAAKEGKPAASAASAAAKK